jgi:hypothetical protein
VYQRRADIINRGFSGYNSKFLLQVPQEILFSGITIDRDGIPPKCCLTIIWLGANDAGLPGLADHHYVSVEDYKANLHKLIDRVQGQTKCPRIMLMTPPPVHHEQRLIYQKQRYGDKATGVLERTLENTGKYATACLLVAEERELACCDVYNLMQQETDWAALLHDGLHFSQAGHAWLGPTVVHAIQTNFAELTVSPDPKTGQFGNSASLCPLIPGNLEAPFHDEIDHTNVEASFTTVLARRPLFGGAIQCQIPSDWRDVSTVRQVPVRYSSWWKLLM